MFTLLLNIHNIVAQVSTMKIKPLTQKENKLKVLSSLPKAFYLKNALKGAAQT